MLNKRLFSYNVRKSRIVEMEIEQERIERTPLFTMKKNVMEQVSILKEFKNIIILKTQLKYIKIKYRIDFLLALLSFILLFPFFVVISLLILFDSPGSIFYRGIRTGYKGKPFRIFKFRTMVMHAEKLGGGTTALYDKRITHIGHILRKTKLDEIPQLINILLGQMSFIGPRPELPQYTKLYNEQEKLILSVRPGITDLSSKHFVNLDEVVGSSDADTAYEQYVLKKKNQLRIQYVKEQSFLLDTYLFFSTLLVVSKKINRFLKF